MAASDWYFAPHHAYTEGREVKCPSGVRGVIASPPEPTTGRVYVQGIGWYGTSQLRVRAGK